MIQALEIKSTGHMRVSSGWACPSIRAYFGDPPGRVSGSPRPVHFVERPANPILWMAAWVQSDSAAIIDAHWFAN